MSDYDTLLNKCKKPFPWDAHEFLQGKFIYVRIQDTVIRLNSLGVPWDFIQGRVEYTEEIVEKEGKKTKWYTAATEGQLTIEGLGSRGAPGAARGTDQDNAGKSAHSFALRKAGSLFGISHYLMVSPKEWSDFVNFMANADLDTEEDLKKAVLMSAKIDGTDPRSWMAGHGVDIAPNVMSSVSDLRTALSNAGRI